MHHSQKNYKKQLRTRLRPVYSYHVTMVDASFSSLWLFLWRSLIRFNSPEKRSFYPHYYSASDAHPPLTMTSCPCRPLLYMWTRCKRLFRQFNKITRLYKNSIKICKVYFFVINEGDSPGGMIVSITTYIPHSTLFYMFHPLTNAVQTKITQLSFWPSKRSNHTLHYSRLVFESSVTTVSS